MGSGTTPGGTGESHYAAGIAVGGGAGQSGGNGKVVLVFDSTVEAKVKTGASTWKSVTDMYFKFDDGSQNGTWKRITDGYVKTGATEWKSLFNTLQGQGGNFKSNAAQFGGANGGADASGGAGSRPQPGNGPHCGKGGGGGFSEGTAAVTAGQALRVAVGEGGHTYVNIGSYPGTLSRPLGGGGTAEPGGSGSPQQRAGTGGGLSGVFSSPVPATKDSTYNSIDGTAPTAYVVAGAGGGTGHPGGHAGYGGGLTGYRADNNATTDQNGDGGGGDQEQGGQGGSGPSVGSQGQTGGLFYGGNSGDDANAGGGGAGYYGGGGGGLGQPQDRRRGGGGSSYYGHPQVTSGSTEEGAENGESGGATQPGYVADTGEGTGCNADGEDGFVLLTATAPGTTTSTTITEVYKRSSTTLAS